MYVVDVSTAPSEREHYAREASKITAGPNTPS